jgi:organic hydroperoxide reductase OsmC/OhrA
MRIEAQIANATQSQAVMLSTDGASKSLAIPARLLGGGASVNGGELLCLALATCYCNVA